MQLASSVMNLSIGNGNYGNVSQQHRTTSSNGINLLGTSKPSLSLSVSTNNTPSSSNFEGNMPISHQSAIPLSGQTQLSTSKLSLHQMQQPQPSIQSSSSGLNGTPSSSTSSLQSLSNYSNTAMLKQQQHNLQQMQSNGQLTMSTMGTSNSNGYGVRANLGSNSSTISTSNQQGTTSNPTMMRSMPQSMSPLYSNSSYAISSIVPPATLTTNMTEQTSNQSQPSSSYLQLNPQHSKMWISQPTLGASSQPPTGSQIRSMMNLNQMATGQV